MTPQRQQLLNLLAKLSDHYSNMRFGQLTVNIAQWARGPIVNATWDATDDEMIAAIQKNLNARKLDYGKQETQGCETMHDKVEAATYHEAAHVVALRSAGRRVKQVCVNEDGSGVTTPDQLPQGDDLIRVALAGMMAEVLLRKLTNIATFVDAYIGASSDRNLIVNAFRQPWLAHNSTGNWHQIQYNCAQTFNERHQESIGALVKAILGKHEFPKCLDEAEIDEILRK